MNYDDEVRIISTLIDHHGRHESIKAGDVSRVPVEVYSSPEVLRAELDILFMRLPQFVGLSADLPRPDTFCTRADLRAPTVLTRSSDGKARAFVNVCRHRGAQVASGRGEGRQLSCPYHAWSYALDGALRRIPDQVSFADVDMASCGLRELALVEHDGMLWTQPDAVTDIGLGLLAPELAQLGLATYSHWRNERRELDMNWKLVIETFLEPYHFASLHRATVGPYFLPNLCMVDTFGPHLREILPRKSMLELTGTPTGDWQLLPHAVIVHILFPGTVLVWLLDHIETWRVTPHPTNPARCSFELDFYLPEGSAKTEEYWDKNWHQTITTVFSEDFPAMEGVQRGLASGVNTHFTVGRNEPALAAFQRAIRTALDRVGFEM